MAKHQICTNVHAYFGRDVSLGNMIVTFSKAGVAEVKSLELAQELEARYPDRIFEGSQTKSKNQAQNINQPLDNKAVERLQAELDKVKETLSHREATLKSSEEETQVWKDLTDKLKEEKAATEAELGQHKIQNEKIFEELKLNIVLLQKKDEELVEFAKNLEIPEEKYKGLKKDELIKIILDESRK